ncbi:MAG: serine/threonine-protein kinase, partial [Burkholderiaceae bacterium]
KGRDLRQLRQDGWRPTPEQAALIVRRIADALAYAHSKGVVHRDVKPANIFMVGRTQPRVLDFGIARVAHRHEGAGDIAAGSPYYMAPEQARHQTVDRRADVFSLGVVLYELLTDQKPFRGTTLAEISQSVIEHDPPLASEVDARVPRALANIAARAMVKDPEQRYRSARTFSRELRHWLDDRDGQAELEEPVRAMRGGWRLWAGSAAAAVVLGSAILYFVGPTKEPAQPLTARVIDQPPATGEVATHSAAPPAEVRPAAPLDPAPPPKPERVAGGMPNTEAAKARPPAAKPAVTAKATNRERRDVKAATENKATPAVKALGVLRLAVSPWGQVEVDGSPAGNAPPLTELSLQEGKHLITIRNADFPPFSTTVTIAPGQAVGIKHKFGS